MFLNSHHNLSNYISYISVVVLFLGTSGTSSGEGARGLNFYPSIMRQALDVRLLT